MGQSQRQCEIYIHSGRPSRSRRGHLLPAPQQKQCNSVGHTDSGAGNVQQETRCTQKIDQTSHYTRCEASFLRETHGHQKSRPIPRPTSSLNSVPKRAYPSQNVAHTYGDHHPPPTITTTKAPRRRKEETRHRAARADEQTGTGAGREGGGH